MKATKQDKDIIYSLCVLRGSCFNDPYNLYIDRYHTYNNILGLYIDYIHDNRQRFYLEKIYSIIDINPVVLPDMLVHILDKHLDYQEKKEIKLDTL